MKYIDCIKWFLHKEDNSKYIADLASNKILLFDIDDFELINSDKDKWLVTRMSDPKSINYFDWKLGKSLFRRGEWGEIKDKTQYVIETIEFYNTLIKKRDLYGNGADNWYCLCYGNNTDVKIINLSNLDFDYAWFVDKGIALVKTSRLKPWDRKLFGLSFLDYCKYLCTKTKDRKLYNLIPYKNYILKKGSEINLASKKWIYSTNTKQLFFKSQKYENR